MSDSDDLDDIEMKDLDLDHGPFDFYLTWEEKTKDLDATAILINELGHMVDAVYYNKLQLEKGNFLTHSGDNTQQEKFDGFDEKITMDIKGL